MKYTDLMIYRNYPESQRQAALLPKIDVVPNADQLKAALSGAFDCAELPSDTAFSFLSTINGKKAAINANDFFERYIKDYASENPVALEAFYGLLDKHFSMILIACEMYKHFPDHNDAIAHTVRFVDQNTFTREEASSLIVSTVDALVCEDGLTVQGKKALENYLNEYNTKEPAQKKSIKYARSLEAVLRPEARQATITSKVFSHALTPFINESAYIKYVPGGILENIDFEPDGSLTFKNLDVFSNHLSTDAYDPSTHELDMQLLRNLCTSYCRQYSKNPNNPTMRVYIPTFFRDLGIDTTKPKANEIFAKIKKLEENSVGFINGTAYVVLHVTELSRDVIGISFPYFSELLRELDISRRVEKKGKPAYLNPAFSFLIHSNIQKEQNKTACELLEEFIKGLSQRGNKPRKGEKYVKYHIAYETLIERVPILKQRLSSTTNISNQNRILRTSFKKFYEFIRTKSDLHAYYIDFRFSDVIPSMTTLQDTLTAQHSGVNPEYTPSKT